LAALSSRELAKELSEAVQLALYSVLALGSDTASVLSGMTPSVIGIIPKI
jgi:hypothetical protein